MKTNDIDLLKSNPSQRKLIYSQEKLPLFQNKIFSNLDAAKASAYGDVRLVQSTQTGFIFNEAFDEALMNYDEHYHNEQISSNYYQAYQENILQLLQSFSIQGKKIIEIGCGKGHFFELLLANNPDCLGFDPSYEGQNPRVIKDYFSAKYNIEADLIILRHTLEHVKDPYFFLQTIAKANNYKGYIFIEVPTFDWIIKKNAFWDVFYEHCNYFTEQSLSTLFHASQSGELFNGQYIYCYAKLSELKDRFSSQNLSPCETILFRESLEKWKNFVNRQDNIVVWGAGAKGSTFVNLIDPLQIKIKAVIDINPQKQNKYIAVSGHPIYSPSKLKEIKCNQIIVMNENYVDEVREMISAMQKNIPLTSL